jgi:hypothetical protein
MSNLADPEIAVFVQLRLGTKRGLSDGACLRPRRAAEPTCLNDIGPRNLSADVHAHRCQWRIKITPTPFSMAIEVPNGLERS